MAVLLTMMKFKQFVRNVKSRQRSPGMHTNSASHWLNNAGISVVATCSASLNSKANPRVRARSVNGTLLWDPGKDEQWRSGMQDWQTGKNPAVENIVRAVARPIVCVAIGQEFRLAAFTVANEAPC